MVIKRIISIIIITLCSLHLQVKFTNVFAQDTVFIDKVIDWGYQLQGYFPGLVSIRDSKFDLIVMDYSFSGGPEDEFSSETIKGLKSDGSCERKIILAYMSIGEAEEFRFYFEKMPKDLLFDEPNPDFPDNIKVKFWDSVWQEIIFGNQNKGADKSYLDRIIDAGFDGVYLDIIDAYEFWGPKETGGNGERETAARDMVDFIVKITDYVRNTRGRTNFIVVPQNGAGIIDPSSYPFADDPVSEADIQKQRYFSAINAIGAEDTFYFGNRENNNPLNTQNETIKLLNIFRDAGKKVLAVDYVQSDEKVDTFHTLAIKEGYVPYATVRDLDTLTINGMHEPVCNNTLTNPGTPTTSVPTPFTSPVVTTSPLPVQNPTPTPPQIPPSTNGKNFTFKCEKDLVRKVGDFEVMSLKMGDTLSCKLVVRKGLINKSNAGIKVQTELKPGNKVSIKVDPVEGVTNNNEEFEITLTAIGKGIDWIAWAIADEDGNLEFNKEAYDSGNAWGIFVVVR